MPHSRMSRRFRPSSETLPFRATPSDIAGGPMDTIVLDWTETDDPDPDTQTSPMDSVVIDWNLDHNIATTTQ